MEDKRTVRLIALALVLGCAVARSGVRAQEIREMEFRDAPVAAILVALGRATGNSIVPDETVRGTASYYFAETSFERALEAFASRFNLFVTRGDEIYTVSAVSIRHRGDGLLAVQAPGVPIAVLLERLSRATGHPILFDRLPHQETSYFATGLALEQILRQLATQLQDHELDERDGAFVFVHRETGAVPPARSDWITIDGDTFSLHSDNTSLPTLLSLLFSAGEREYQLLKRSAPMLPPLDFAGKGFDELLRLILEHADAAFAVRDGIYYIVDGPRAASGALGLETRVVAVEHLPVGRLLDLIPADQTAGVTVGADREANLISVTGTPTGVARFVELLTRLDRRTDGRTYTRIDLDYLPPAALPGLLPRELSTVSLTPVPDSSAVLALATPVQTDALRAFVELVDAPDPRTLVTLGHIRVEDLLAHLPTGFDATRIVTTADPQRFFFRGSHAQHERFLADLAALDRPVPQLRYHVLVLQVQSGRALEIDVDLSNALTTPDSEQAFVASLGNLLSLNFDVVSTFGYQFAAKLNASIGETTATVVADTTLRALSGERVGFRNTNTFRYRDIGVDPDTGEQRSTGVVREIQSGLILDIDGRVVGDAVVMDVSATISRRGSDGVATGNPPPTSERVVQTRVRTESGRPLAISGLRLRESEQSIRKTPVLADIPLLGLLFQGRRESVDATELAVYIVPYVEPGTAEVAGDTLVEIYERNFGSGDE